MWRPLALVLLLAVFGCQSCQPDEEEDCPSGQTRCNGVCRDAAYFQASPLDCGACGVVCGAGTCAGGACQCDPGATACPANPRCADTQNDEANCGACGVACTKPGSTCAAGVCGCHAPASADCGSYCADTLSDADNCGVDAASGCGHVCPLTNDVCLGGTCACPASLPTRCGDTCVNTLADPGHCGPAEDPASCERVCPLANQICDVGVCDCPATLPNECPPGTPSACVNLDTDELNCGACGNVCPSGATCTGAAPRCECPGTEVVCGANPGACRDLSTDESNCGACGNACPAGATCTGATPACECPAAQPVTCASTCCAGNGCCDSGCQTAHSNGLGGAYFDCGQLDEWTAAQARLAAESWSPSGTTVEVLPQCGTPFCLCRQTSSAAAVWCYAGSPDTMRGHVVVTPSPNCLAAACPFLQSPAWH